MSKERDYTNQSIVQAVAVLDAVANARGPMSMSDIAEASGVKKDATFRILWNLDRLGILQKVGDHYRLGMKLALYWSRKRSGLEADRDKISRDIESLEKEG